MRERHPSPHCAYCQESVVPGQDLVVAADDRVFHVPCYVLVRRPSARLDERGAPRGCAACGEEIQSSEDAVAIGRILVHSGCYRRSQPLIPPFAA